jgi:two-component system alkaline phosphatase synthesis response regulator PhoP
LDEFLLRIERLLTKSSWYQVNEAGIGTNSEAIATYAFGDNDIDFSTFTAHGKEGAILLTEQEVKLLRLFVANRGKPLSREAILKVGWGYTSGDISTRTVDNFIVRFRKYFENNPKEPIYFKSLRSVGYIFDHD